MKYPINFKEFNETFDFFEEVLIEFENAKNYLFSFKWCKEIKNTSLYFNLGSKLCIFLFEIENTSRVDDSYLWVLVGDIPSMYLDINNTKTVREVLEDYVALGEDWIKNIKLGKSINNCYPFQAEPTKEMATLLENRTNFIKKTLLKNILDIKLQYFS